MIHLLLKRIYRTECTRRRNHSRLPVEKTRRNSWTSAHSASTLESGLVQLFCHVRIKAIQERPRYTQQTPIRELHQRPQYPSLCIGARIIITSPSIEILIRLLENPLIESTNQSITDANSFTHSPPSLIVKKSRELFTVSKTHSKYQPRSIDSFPP